MSAQERIDSLSHGSETTFMRLILKGATESSTFRIKIAQKLFGIESVIIIQSAWYITRDDSHYTWLKNVMKFVGRWSEIHADSQI